MAHAGYYFPHDEFYDASMREVLAEIGHRARPGARVASESQLLASHYAQRHNRNDLVCISLSDPDALKHLAVGDFVIVARGQRYFSNHALISLLSASAMPDFQILLQTVHSVDGFMFDQTTL